ncbi:MAG: NAD(P)H-hydrate epimerase, partial [Pseudomonadota bacterium]
MTTYPHNTPLYRTADIRRIEALESTQPLMQRAGLATAELARSLVETGKRVLVIAGPGNNGGDAFVVARHLKTMWFNVQVVFTGDAAKLGTDAKLAFEQWRDAGGTRLTHAGSVSDCGLIVDGLFGIGLQRELTGRYAKLVAWMNSATCPVLALDVPSGLDADTGRVMGCAVRATHTVTFIALKPGLLTLDGPDHCGEVQVATLDVDANALVSPKGHVIGDAVLERAWPPRKRNTHKGDYGSVGVIGGAQGMVGAALLAGRAALKLGAGRVYVGLSAHDAPPVDPLQPELMLRRAEEVCAIDRLSALGVGPGLSTTPEAQTLVGGALATTLP